jgi:hypothetical protein
MIPQNPVQQNTQQLELPLLANQTYIYESPDGGDTVYRRLIGSSPESKELHHVSERKQSLEHDLQEKKLWGKIHRAAKQDPALKDMLDQIVVYYQLKNSP